MKEKILTVEDSFNTQGIGLLFVGIWDEKMPNFRVGANVKILRPDGSEIFSSIKLINAETNRQTQERYLTLTFTNEVGKEDVPNGSVIYLV